MTQALDQYQADRRRMKAYIAVRTPEEGIEVVLAEGEDGEVQLELDPVRDNDGEWDLHWETNEPEYVDLQLIYDHFRRQEMTVGDQSGELARLRVQALEKEVALGLATTPTPNCRKKNEPTGRPLAEKTMFTTKEVAVLLVLQRLRSQSTKFFQVEPQPSAVAFFGDAIAFLTPSRPC